MQKQLNPRMQYLDTVLDRPRMIWERSQQQQNS